ncbi:DUF4291 domain-containing protein [Paenibacillus tritici]|uniref:DUF4291 domain-containing protein n=1 Tax=Paenibacillus tritici TaxID=1873425 RepID=A0ABX2DV14_9BACL|nr:DUF4291 domain-containing protein [Paenibacillus tritici]NQX48215.1 DUF4291 domain-containing protein [Paenibacillus tritici]
MEKNKNTTITAEEKRIMALYNLETIRVYQAYNHEIADEVLELGRFGSSFKINRMTWIKPSFLWMMYRSGWGTKPNQERILAIDITREGFNTILSNVILSAFDPEIYTSYNEWQRKLLNSQVRCQWDPDRDEYGNQLTRRAIQLGLKGDMVQNYLYKWIVEINDITEYVLDAREAVRSDNFRIDMLPNEVEYPLEDSTKKTLGILIS